MFLKNKRTEETKKPLARPIIPTNVNKQTFLYLHKNIFSIGHDKFILLPFICCSQTAQCDASFPSSWCHKLSALKEIFLCVKMEKQLCWSFMRFLIAVIMSWDTEFMSTTSMYSEARQTHLHGRLKYNYENIFMKFIALFISGSFFYIQRRGSLEMEGNESGIKLEVNSHQFSSHRKICWDFCEHRNRHQDEEWRRKTNLKFFGFLIVDNKRIFNGIARWVHHFLLPFFLLFL